MEIILLTKIENLGELGDIVKVKPGYARNYLIPYGKARTATPENVEEFGQHKAELERSAATLLAQAEERGRKLGGLALTIPMKVSEAGTLFGSVGTTEIMEAVAGACKEEVHRNEIRLPEGALRELGEYEISLHLHPSVTAVVQLNIVAEE